MLKSIRKSRNRYFYHFFVSPGDAPGAITLNVWMEREFDAYKLSCCMCLSSYNRFWDRARYWSKIVIPQGSVLGPAQFVMYTEDLGELITDFSVLPLFADDTHDSQLLTSTTPSGVADVCRRLERCVTAVHDWCTQSWAWVHFAKSKPTQSTSWLTQSNSIHNDRVYSDPHDIQSNPLYPAVAKHCSTKMFSFSI